MSKRPIELQFPDEQRIEIYLLNSTERVLTKWSDNHAFEKKPATILINPDEHIEYNEKIATRDLTPNTVFIAGFSSAVPRPAHSPKVFDCAERSRDARRSMERWS